MRFDRWELEPMGSTTGLLWVGWRCWHTGSRYGEAPVLVADLDTLPVGADVRLLGQRWRRVAA